MKLPIITADQRLAEQRGVKGVLVGKSGIGKTSQLWTLTAIATLFFDLEAGDLAVEGWAGDTTRNINTGSVYLNCEFVVMEGEYPQFVGLISTKLAIDQIGRRALASIALGGDGKCAPAADPDHACPVRSSWRCFAPMGQIHARVRQVFCQRVPAR